MPEGSYDLLVCIRCHAHLSLVLDTEQSVRLNTNPDHVKVVFAVDGGRRQFAQQLIHIVGNARVYEAVTPFGWGAGLYNLLTESILYFRQIYRFQHFQSIDYDTIYLGSGVDTKLLGLITSDDIGLLGTHNTKNEHWQQVFNKDKERFEKMFGKVPSAYIPGEGVQGGVMTLTRSLLAEMEKLGMFQVPFNNVKKYTCIADDHLLPIFVRQCGKAIVNVPFIRSQWSATEDPRGLEKKGILVFHPTKMNPRNKNISTDIMVRSYFRKLRGVTDPLR